MGFCFDLESFGSEPYESELDINSVWKKFSEPWSQAAFAVSPACSSTLCAQSPKLTGNKMCLAVLNGGRRKRRKEEGEGVGDEEANSSPFKELFLREEGVRRPWKILRPKVIN